MLEKLTALFSGKIALGIATVVVGIIGFSSVFIANTIMNQPAFRRSSAKTPTTERSLSNPFPTPTPIALAPSTPKATPTPTPTPTPATTGVDKEVSGITSTGWAYEGFRDVLVIPRTRSDEGAIFLDIKRSTFTNISDIYYKLTYTADTVGSQVVEGNFEPTTSLTADDVEPGMKIIVRELVLGTCSITCDYHQNPKSFKLVVTTTRTDGETTYTQILTKSSL